MFFSATVEQSYSGLFLVYGCVADSLIMQRPAKQYWANEDGAGGRVEKGSVNRHGVLRQPY